MALHIQRRLTCITAVVIVTLHVTSSAKTNARPVYEVINEQPRADDRQIKTGKTNLPYGNPLAGNSQTNARLHAHNQQAMFHAERVRQHKAQLQRWTKTPMIDSYMRAYHESQENHQLALEQQQTKAEAGTPAPSQRESAKRNPKQIDPVKLSEADAMKGERTRNHRSYGSVEYQQYVVPRYRTVHLPAPESYSQGRVKPNTINEMVHTQSSNLYADLAAGSERIYPAQQYQSVQNIDMLNSLLNKNPGDQLTEFNALINSAKVNVNHDKELETPIDLYFYLKDKPNKASNIKEHTQIKEDVNLAEESKEMVGFREHSASVTPQLDVTASKNIQFINSELTSQILSAGYNPLFQEQYSVKEEETEPTYQALQYAQQPTAYGYDAEDTDGDLSQRYLHHSANSGVQHLNNDGTGVSAYDEENVSINEYSINQNGHFSRSRSKRSPLERNQLVLSTGNHSTDMLTGSSNVTQPLKPEPWVRIRPVQKSKRTAEFGTFLTTPNFPIGEAIDYSANDPFKRPSRNYGTQEAFYDEDYASFDDDQDYEYETSDYTSPNAFSIPRKKHFADAFETYAPSETYIQNVKINGEFTKGRAVKRFPHIPISGAAYGSNNFAIAPIAYGPQYSTAYSAPHSFDALTPGSPHLPEPVYLLTQRQLAKLVGHHNLNIEHLDVYQLSKSPSHYPRKYRKRSPYRSKQFRKNIIKLHNLHVI
ncbi:unnamed protein product, partial [Iphiclides podalirius]